MFMRRSASADHSYGISQISLPDRKLISKLGFAGIYFVTFEGEPEGSPIKVGIANDPFSRFATLQSSNWRKLKVLELLYVRGASVRVIESLVHSDLRDGGFHHHGEWFFGDWQGMVQIAKKHLSGCEVYAVRALRRKLASIREEATLKLRPPSNGKALRYQVPQSHYEVLVRHEFMRTVPNLTDAA